LLEFDFKRANDQRVLLPISFISYFNGLPRFLKFLLVGGINTAFGYALFGAIYLLTGRHVLAVVVATVIGVVFNYFSTGRLVFTYRGILAFVPFVLGYAGICVVNVVALDVLINQGVHPLLGQLLVLSVCVPLSFWISRYVFMKRAS